MNQSRNSAAILGTFRELQSCIQKAEADGYVITNDDVKLYLFTKAEETGVPALFKKFWKLRYGADELPDGQELLRLPEVEELFSPPKKKPR